MQLSELKKAEKGKCFAESMKTLEAKMQEICSAAENKLNGKIKEAEMQMHLLQKEAESYKEEVKETHDTMEKECMRLEEAARVRMQETERERAALETRVAVLQAEVESGRIEREEEVASHEHQLSDAKRQQETVEGELKVVWKEMKEKQKRWACGKISFDPCDCHSYQSFTS